MKSSSVQGPVRSAIRSHGSTAVPLHLGAAGVALTGRHGFAAEGRRPQVEPQRSSQCHRSSIWLFSTFAPNHSPAPLPKQYDKMAIGAFARRPRKPIAHAVSTDRYIVVEEDAEPTIIHSSHSTSTAQEQTATVLPPQTVKHRRAIRRSLISSDAHRPVEPPLELDKDQLLSLVGGPVDGTAAEFYEAHRDPFRGGFAAPDGPNIRVSDTKQDVSFPKEADMHRFSPDTQKTIDKLCTSVRKRLLHPELVSLDKIHETYQELPEPRMLNLTGGWRKELLRVMGMPKKRDANSMIRYFALVADVKNAGLTLSKRQWNYALAFAAKYTAKVQSRQLESALRLWWEMEREGRQTANAVTFNILFDAATKAGSFALADMIYKEMENRNIPFNHFHHVTLIYYFGLQRDSDGIRAAYKEMVEAGELVDSIALNCVISGLLRSGEEAAAEDTYRRMRAAGKVAPEQPEKSYMVSKAITKALMMLTKVARDHPSLKKNFQKGVRISPDLRTFKLFIHHYAVRVGDLGKVVYFLDEMKAEGVALHPTLFLGVFRGFFLHGGYPGTDWSEQRLDTVVAALYQTQDQMGESFRIEAWVVIWLLRATKRCCSKQKLEKTFEEISRRWNIPPERQLDILDVCDKMVGRNDDMAAWRIFESVTHRRRALGDQVIR